MTKQVLATITGACAILLVNGCATSPELGSALMSTLSEESAIVRQYPDGTIVRRMNPSVAQRTQRLVNGQMVDVYWAGLTEAQRRELYSAVVLNTTVEQRNTNGSFSVAPVGASYQKGFYRVTHDVFLGQQVPCQPSNPSAGLVKMGVLLEVQMLLQSKKAGLNIASMVPLAAAVSSDRVSGSLAIRLWGFGATSGILNSYLTPGGELNMQSVTKAMEAMAVARAILEDDSAVTTPYYIELIENSSGSCNSSPVISPSIS